MDEITALADGVPFGVTLATLPLSPQLSGATGGRCCGRRPECPLHQNQERSK
jgi:hypothetical protein